MITPFLSCLSIRHLTFLLWGTNVSRRFERCRHTDTDRRRSDAFSPVSVHPSSSLSLSSYRGDAVRRTRCTRLGTQGLGAAPAYGRPHLIITSWVRGRRRNVFPLLDHTGIDIASIEETSRVCPARVTVVPHRPVCDFISRPVHPSLQGSCLSKGRARCLRRERVLVFVGPCVERPPVQEVF